MIISARSHSQRRPSRGVFRSNGNSRYVSHLGPLSEYIGELIASGHSLETKTSDLCSFVSKVITNVDMLCTLSATDHIVSLLNACRVVLIILRRRCGSEAHIA